jgi:ubiquitin carboxyl-terminal hydrolase L3
MAMDPSGASTYRKHFIPLESNPDVFTELIHKLGIASSLRFQDVLSLDPELLSFIPRPVHALILVFPTTQEYERRARAEDFNVIDVLDGNDETEVLFFRQTINNACGLYAILHAFCNGEARNSFGKPPTTSRTPSLTSAKAPDSTMDQLLKVCLPAHPKDRALALENSQELERAYDEVAQKGDTAPPASAEDEVDFHYIAFVKSHINGHLYQLDGDRRRPIKLAPLQEGEDVLSEKCLEVIRGMMIEDNVNFSLMALVGQT